MRAVAAAVKLIAAMEAETILLDENGVPGTDELFLVGGLSFRVEAAILEAAWRKERDAIGVGNRKARDLTDEELVRFAQFARDHGALPCVCYSKLSEDERLLGQRVFKAASTARAFAIGDTTFGPFRWALHVMVAASTPSTPPPPQSAAFAAFTTTSTSSSVMSPWMISTRPRKYTVIQRIVRLAARLSKPVSRRGGLLWRPTLRA